MSSADRRRVVVTGVGMVAPVGIGRAACWGNLLAGRSGIGRLLGDRRDQLAPRAEGDADLLQVLFANVRQGVQIDLVLGEYGRVSAKPDSFQPVPDGQRMTFPGRVR